MKSHLFFVAFLILAYISLSAPVKIFAACLGSDFQQCEDQHGLCIWSDSDAKCLPLSTGTTDPNYSATRFSDVADSFIQSIGLKPDLTSISGIVNALIPLAMTIAGLILFLMLIAGGFQMLTSASDPKAADAGKQRITTALIGFLIVFASYWIVQILEVVLGVNILG